MPSVVWAGLISSVEGLKRTEGRPPLGRKQSPADCPWTSAVTSVLPSSPAEGLCTFWSLCSSESSLLASCIGAWTCQVSTSVRANCLNKPLPMHRYLPHWFYCPGAPINFPTGISWDRLSNQLLALESWSLDRISGVT